MRHCPACSSESAPRSENPAFPFCSERCRLLDLGRWLDEDFRIPGPVVGDSLPEPEEPSDD